MDALLLLATVSDARKALIGGTVQDLQPAGPHGLWFELATTSSQDSLLVTADEAFPRIARGARRPARGGAPTPLAAVAQRVLSGSRLLRIDRQGLDRLVSFEFASPGGPAPAGRLTAELFGHQPNLILLEPTSGQILEAARHVSTGEGRAVGPGLLYRPPSTTVRPDPLLLETVEAVGAVLEPSLIAGMAPATALRQLLAGLNALWAQEVLALAEGGSAPDVARSLIALLDRIATGPWEPHLVVDTGGNPLAATPLRLRHLPPEAQQPCASLGETVAKLARARTLRRDLADRQAALRQVLHRLEDRLESRRRKLLAEAEAFAQAATWQRMGEILVAHQHEVPRGATEVVLPDHAAGPGATLAIPLDPALPPAATGERFFKLARRSRRGAVRVASRLVETEADLERIRGWAARLAGAHDREATLGIQQEVEATSRLLRPQDRADLGMGGDSGAAPSRSGERATRARPPHRRGGGPEPRRFVSSDGLPILVGRDNAGNDYLTLHLARSEDVWLHVEGYAGSHVVIRVQGQKGGLPRRSLVQAAHLAAYYSQAREHGKVAVDYTLRKYVRKPRKSKPGLVTITQVKTIIVSPDKSLVAKLADRTRA